MLQPGGRFVLNIKDHIRAGKLQPVTAWHIEALGGAGLCGKRRVRGGLSRYALRAQRTSAAWTMKA